MRIIGGFIAFINLIFLSGFWSEWFGEKGYMPAYLGGIWFPPRTPLPSALSSLAPDGLPRIDLIYGIVDPRITIPFFILVTVAAFLTCIGLFTRYSAFALAIGMVSLHHRDGAILHGGDTVLRLLVIYLAVSPCGKACSLDRLIGIWRGKISHEPVLVSVWSQRLIAFNVALLYFSTIWLKWDGDKWRNFTAVYYPQHLAEFYRFPVPDFFRSMWVARISTFMTVISEFSLATLVFFPPARRYVLVAGVIMHLWIEYSMNIPLFSFLMITMYIAFFQGEEIQAWAQRMGMRMRKLHVTVRLPKGRQLSSNAVTFLTSLDPFGLVSYMPGESADFEATRFDGTAIPAIKAISTRSLGAWPFLWIPTLPQKLLANSTVESPILAARTEDSPPGNKEHATASIRRKRK